MTRGLDEVLASLADPTRRAVVERLLQGPATPGELAREIPAASPQALARLARRSGGFHRDQ